jgi:hypothetical protein
MYGKPDAIREYTPQEVAQKIRLEYSRGVKDHTVRLLEDIGLLCASLEDPGFDMRSVLTAVADMISRHLGIASIAIALWNPSARAYRYEHASGVGDDALEGFKKLSYTRDQIVNEESYPSHEISRWTRLYLSEEHPYADDEIFSYNRPGLLGKKRRSITESLEADYLCVFFRGPGEDILGWMDISGTRLKTLPDAATIRWLEMLGFIITLAIRLKR